MSQEDVATHSSHSRSQLYKSLGAKRRFGTSVCKNRGRVVSAACMHPSQLMMLKPLRLPAFSLYVKTNALSALGGKVAHPRLLDNTMATIGSLQVEFREKKENEFLEMMKGSHGTGAKREKHGNFRQIGTVLRLVCKIRNNIRGSSLSPSRKTTATTTATRSTVSSSPVKELNHPYPQRGASLSPGRLKSAQKTFSSNFISQGSVSVSSPNDIYGSGGRRVSGEGRVRQISEVLGGAMSQTTMGDAEKYSEKTYDELMIETLLEKSDVDLSSQVGTQ